MLCLGNLYAPMHVCAQERCDEVKATLEKIRVALLELRQLKRDRERAVLGPLSAYKVRVFPPSEFIR